MAKINVYGMNINMKALAAAARDTETNTNGNNHIIYNTESGNIYNVWIPSPAYWSAPSDIDGIAVDNIACVARTNRHMTQQQIADAIYNAVK